LGRFLVKYLQPHQQHITLILLSCVESAHELVSPDSLAPLVATLMREFVTGSSICNSRICVVSHCVFVGCLSRFSFWLICVSMFRRFRFSSRSDDSIGNQHFARNGDAMSARTR
jgi:hypothetical protein